MAEFLRAYRAKPWPKLEIPNLQRQHLISLVVFMAALITIGWLIWSSAQTRAVYFGLMGLAIPVFFLLKSRFVALIGLLTFEVILAFLFMGNTNFALTAVMALVGAIIAFESPIIMYMLLILAVWFDKSLFAIGRANYVELVIGCALLVGWVFKGASRDRTAPKPLHFYEKLPASLLFFWAVAGFLLWCPSRAPEGFFTMKWLILGFLFFLITPLLIRSEKELRLAACAWILAGLIASVATIYAIMAGLQPASSSQLASGASMTAQYKNPTAGIISFSFFLALAAFFWVEKTKQKWILGAILAVLLFALLLLQSRMAFVGLVFGFGIFWLAETFLRPEKKSAMQILLRLFVPVSLAVLVLVGLFCFGLTEMMGNYAELFKSPDQIGSMQWRLQTWDLVRTLMVNEGHLLRGLGVGAFYVFAPQYGFPLRDFTVDVALMHPHSLYLDIIVHYGIIGLLIFMWLSLSNLSNLWRCYRGSQIVLFKYMSLGLFCALSAWYMRGFLDGALTAVEWWLIIGLAAATISVWKDYFQNNVDNRLG